MIISLWLNFKGQLFHVDFILQAFLSKYVDETAINRRRSQSEDDNPPTPIPLDDNPWPTPKAASPARHGPMTPPISSNPHTPASPHPVGMTQVCDSLIQLIHRTWLFLYLWVKYIN